MADMQIVLSGRKIEAQYVEMKVPLYSYGCEKKIKKALSHLKGNFFITLLCIGNRKRSKVIADRVSGHVAGIHSVQVDYHQQKVTVWGICNREDVLAAVRKKRTAARFWDGDELLGPGEHAPAPGDAPKLYLAAFTAYRLRKSWKKLFPLIRL